MADLKAKAATLGHPSYVWRFGQERRLSLIRRYVPLEGRRILDIGCGIGTYVRRFQQLSPYAYGIDVDWERVRRGSAAVPGLAVAASEYLPFRSDTFDVVVLNEVIEHVRDDMITLQDACRVVKPGGHIAIFAPNRFYPFETHGFYLGRRYIFGNIPLINYLPNVLRNRLAHHVRAYLTKNLAALVRGLDVKLIVHGYIFPGFDNFAGHSRPLGQALRRLFYPLEGTPLAILGLSHFLILEKTGNG